MLPYQASLMPVHIALTRFFQEEGIGVFIKNYPYWYFGTTPFRYLTGPVLPLLLTIADKLLYFLNLYETFFLLVAVFMIFGAIGMYLFIKELDRVKKTAILSSVLFLLGPLVPLLFRFSDGLSLMSFSILPFIYWQYARFIKTQVRKEKEIKKSNDTLIIFLIAFAILTNTQIINTMLLGMVAIALAIGKWKRIEHNFKETLKLFGFALINFETKQDP